MSADNFAICPRCRIEFNKNLARIQLEAEQSYGKIPAEEYLERIKMATDSARTQQENTFREDYELGVYPDGSFRVSYGGGCGTCGLEFSFKHEQKVDLSSGTK